jgi:hypothetical protein
MSDEADNAPIQTPGCDPPKIPDTFEQLLGISRQALALSRFNTVYHALAAALHWAKSEEDDERLSVVARHSHEVLQWIDRHAPDYEHSTASSKRRHAIPSIFATLAHQADTAARMIRYHRDHPPVQP